MRWSRLLCLCWVLILSCSHDDSHLFFTDVPYPRAPLSIDEAPRFELVREYGALEEGLVFGSISGLAVSEMGTLAVVDSYGCRIWLIDQRSGSGRTIGGCGDGPGEFRRPTVAAYSGDTLHVVDAAPGDPYEAHVIGKGDRPAPVAHG
jgi:hypothetical protein